MIPIIDTHQHLWDLSKFTLSWLPKEGPLSGSHTMQRYLREAKGLNIAQTVYMEVDVVHAQRQAEAEYVVELCRCDDNPMTGAVIGGDPSDAHFADYVRQFKGSPYVKGVRQVLHGGQGPGYALASDFIRNVQLLGELGLRFDLCLPLDGLQDGAKIAEHCPDTRFVLDHCGNADPQAKDLAAWKRDMEAIAHRPNVICKISGIVARARPDWKPDDLAPIVAFCAESFGHDRVVFGSDWPVCTERASLRQWVEALAAIVSHWPETNRRKLWHDNAARFYALK